MNTGSTFLKNTWYVAAWSHEIAAQGMLARTVTRVPLLFWRDGAGEVVALDDPSVTKNLTQSVLAPDPPMLAMRMDTALASFRTMMEKAIAEEGGL